MQNKKIRVCDFVAKYVKCASDNLKKQMIKDAVPKKYVPLLQKTAISRAIVAKSMVTKDGIYQKNSVSLYLNYIMGMLMIYCPSLELSPDLNFENYDLLKSSGLIEKIMDEIGDDLAEYTTVYNMEVDDIIANQLSVQSFIGDQVTRATTIFSGICKSGLDTLSSLDEDKVEKILDVVKKAIDR